MATNFVTWHEMETLDLSNSAGVVSWHNRFELYCKTNKDVKPTNKVAFYLTHIGKEAYDLLVDLAFPTNVETESIANLKALIVNHIEPPNFEATERDKFNNLVRKQNETFRQFIVNVKHQAAKCNFGANLETVLRDRLVAGCNDTEVKRKLLAEKALTYNEARIILQDNDNINRALDSGQEVMYARKQCQPTKGHSNERQQPQHSPQSESSQEKRSRKKYGPCLSCGGDHLRQSCKFRHVKCFKCQKTGHIAKVCKSVSAKFVDNNTESPSSDDMFINTFHVDSKSHLIYTLKFENGKTCPFIIDTGSPVNFMPLHKFQDLQLGNEKDLQRTDTTIRGVSGQQLPVIGKADVRANGKSVTFFITRFGPFILGLNGLRELDVEIALHADSVKTLPPLIADLVHRCSRTEGGMKVQPVKLEATMDPIFCKTRPLAFGMREPVKKQLDEMVSNGIITPVDASSWATPIVTPLKANGLPRICGDYRVTLNKGIKQSACTTADIEDMFSDLNGSVLFSKIDLTHAFLQIPLSDDSKPLTTITTPWGLYQYNFLPFGISVSSAVFQRTIDRILNGLDGVKAYQDDIIIFGKSQTEHNLRLQKLLQRLVSHNVCINASKSVFLSEKIPYLGYCLDGRGITIDKQRIQPVLESPKPKNRGELRSFLGFAQYFAKFIPHFSTIAEPLYQLSNADEFQWSLEHDASFNSMLKALTNDTVLGSFQPGASSTLTVDASDVGLGGVLEQFGKPILYIARRLSKSERGYSQTQKEALAIYWAVKRLHKYLFGSEFLIVTDHESLKHIFSPSASVNRSTSSMLQRWAVALSGYNYSIKHQPGSKIPHADFLSRYSFQAEPPKQTSSHFVSPMPISRNELILETRHVYGSILSAMRKGWSTSAKKKFPDIYARRDDLAISTDNVISMDSRLLIPPPCRLAVLHYLHSSHLGRDKMISLSRLSCWWPTINKDIADFARNCQQCHSSKPLSHTNTIPWPVSYMPMQRIHADFCGPFLQKYYALVIEDSFSRFPEVFFTTNATAEFTQEALRKFFAREGIAQTMVTDNGPHFSAASLNDWLRRIGCHHVFTAPRHPQSNGLAERFIRTLKTAVSAASVKTFGELALFVDNFLLQYRNASHSASGKSPALLFKGRNLRSSQAMDTTEVMFYRGNDNRPSHGVVLQNLGKRMFQIIDSADGSIHRRHFDQVHVSSLLISKPPSSSTSSTDQPPPLSPAANSSTPRQPRLTASPLLQTSEIVPQISEPADLSHSHESPVLRRSTRTRWKPQRYGEEL